MKGKVDEANYTPEEAARRRDEVIRRMVNTPPQPHGKPKPKKKRPAQKSAGARKKG